jgi:hypothetical protein
MECQQKDRLMREYRLATDAYSRSVQQLHEKMGVSAKVEYERLAVEAEQSRTRSEEARREMELHVAHHGC